MARIALLLVATTLALSSLAALPPAAAYHDHPCEDVRELGVAACWPFWTTNCVQRTPPKFLMRCFEGGEPL